MKYSFADVDLWVELAREYVRVTGGIPESVWGTFIEMTSEDLRLGIYGHHRILRYPALKKAFLSMNSDDEDSDGGQQAMMRMKKPGVKPAMQLRQDQMFR